MNEERKSEGNNLGSRLSEEEIKQATKSFRFIKWAGILFTVGAAYLASVDKYGFEKTNYNIKQEVERTLKADYKWHLAFGN